KIFGWPINQSPSFLNKLLPINLRIISLSFTLFLLLFFTLLVGVIHNEYKKSNTYFYSTNLFSHFRNCSFIILFKYECIICIFNDYHFNDKYFCAKSIIKKTYIWC